MRIGVAKESWILSLSHLCSINSGFRSDVESQTQIVESTIHAFTPAIQAAGIDPKGRSLHSLRHTFALREYARSGDIYKVKSLLGHSSVTVTEIYTKFPEQYLAQAFGEREEIVRELDKDSMFSA